MSVGLVETTKRPIDLIINYAISFFRGAGSLDRSCDNATKFAVFRDNRDNVFSRKQGTLSNHLKPDCRLVQFLEHDFELVNEIGTAFRAPRLAIVSGVSGTGSQNLRSEERRVGKE